MNVNGTARRPNMQKKPRTIAVAALVIVMAIAACRQKTDAPGGLARPAAAPPSTAAVLKLTPEGCVVAVAIPSVEKAEAQVHALLRRGAPKDVDMDAEINVLTAQFARGANAFEAKSVADIAAIKGLDPEQPMAVFFGRTKEGAPAPPPGQAGFEREIMRYLGFEFTAPMTVVIPYAKRQEAEKFVVEWGGAGTMEPKDLAEPQTTLFARQDGSFAYFFTDSLLVAGTSADLVRGVADRMTAPAAIRYGTPECPADNPDEIVQLVRTDLVPTDGAPAGIPFLGGGMPGGMWAAAAQLGRGWIEPYKGSDPMVLTWNFEAGRLALRSRLDYAKHPEAKAALATAAPLAHLNAAPKSTLGIWAMQLTAQTRANLQRSAAQDLGAQGGLPGQLAGSFGKVLDMVGGEATIAILGPGADTSKTAAMIEFQDGEAARNAMKEMGIMPLKAETYNNTDIYSFVFPPVAVYYTVTKNTFVIAGGIETVKTLIDTVSSGKATSFAGSLDPPLDTSVPRQQTFVARRELFTAALLPMLEGNGMASKETSQYAARAFERVRDARMTTEVVNDWQDTRLTVQFE